MIKQGTYHKRQGCVRYVMNVRIYICCNELAEQVHY